MLRIRIKVWFFLVEFVLTQFFKNKEQTPFSSEKNKIYEREYITLCLCSNIKKMLSKMKSCSLSEVHHLKMNQFFIFQDQIELIPVIIFLLNHNLGWNPSDPVSKFSLNPQKIYLSTRILSIISQIRHETRKLIKSTAHLKVMQNSFFKFLK